MHRPRVKQLYFTSAIVLACLLISLLALTLNAKLYAAPALEGPDAAAQTGSISGRVTASDGGNLGPLRVIAVGIVNIDNQAEAHLDTTGHYTLTGLPPGDYQVTFNADNELPYIAEFYNDTRDFESVDPVAVTVNNTTSGIDAVLQLGGIITGQVTSEASGAPLAGIEVNAFAREIEDAPDRSTTTDADGRYQLTGLYGGKYKVCFSYFDNPSGDNPYLPECYDNRPPEAEEQLIQVTEGAVTPNINAALTLGGTIQGHVTSGVTGEPLAGIRVDAERVGNYYTRRTSTDASGFYTLTTLPTGNYHVGFNLLNGNPDYGVEYYNDKSSSESADPVSVTASLTTTGIDAALELILNITGHVESAITHQPIRSLEVTVYNAAGEKQDSYDYTDALGNFSIVRLEPGPYRLRFGDNEYTAQYYANRVLFEDADWVTVTAGVVISHIDASLIRRTPAELHVATASPLADVLMAVRNGYFSPIYTLDGGQSWHTFATLPAQGLQNIRQLAVVPKDDPQQPVRFLLAPYRYAFNTPPAIYRTADGGASWSSFAPPADPRCNAGVPSTIENIVASPADPQRLYALTRCIKTTTTIEPVSLNYWSLYFSSDGGVNWQPTTIPLVENGVYTFPFEENPFLASPVDPGRIYANLFTPPDRDTWRRSDNNGQTWITETFTLSVLALDWTNAAKLYAVEDKGENNAFRYTGKRSDNTGATWQDWAQQPCRTSFQQLLALPTAGTLLMLCDQGLYRSKNGGDSWELLTAQSGGSLVAHSGDHNLVLWVRGAELFSSSDQGATWNDLGGWQETSLPDIHRQ